MFILNILFITIILIAANLNLRYFHNVALLSKLWNCMVFNLLILFNICSYVSNALVMKRINEEEQELQWRFYSNLSILFDHVGWQSLPISETTSSQFHLWQWHTFYILYISVINHMYINLIKKHLQVCCDL